MTDSESCRSGIGTRGKTQHFVLFCHSYIHFIGPLHASARTRGFRRPKTVHPLKLGLQVSISLPSPSFLALSALH